MCLFSYLFSCIILVYVDLSLHMYYVLFVVYLFVINLLAYMCYPSECVRGHLVRQGAGDDNI